MTGLQGVPPGNLPAIPRKALEAMRQQHDQATLQVGMGLHYNQTCMRAVSATAEFALSEVAYLTRMKGELQQACPDATEALALIANTASMAIARSVHRFGSELL